MPLVQQKIFCQTLNFRLTKIFNGVNVLLVVNANDIMTALYRANLGGNLKVLAFTF